jgi:hypothetical protein
MTSFAGFFVNSGIAHSMPLLLAQYSTAEDPISPQNRAMITVFQIVAYVFVAYCTQTYLKKLNYEKPWFAWIPIVNIYAVLEAGEQENPLVWTILACIPCIGLISLIKLIPAYITICRRLGKSPAILWTFLLCGLGGIIVPAILAFT